MFCVWAPSADEVWRWLASGETFPRMSARLFEVNRRVLLSEPARFFATFV